MEEPYTPIGELKKPNVVRQCSYCKGMFLNRNKNVNVCYSCRKKLFYRSDIAKELYG